MKLTWYNRPRQFDNGIVWVRLIPNRLALRFGEHSGFGLWFCRAFPWVVPLTPWTVAPRWLQRKARAA